MGALLTILLVCAAAPASAHGIGQRYDLPLPFGLFAAGGALAVLLSFVVAAWFMRPRAESGAYPRVELTARPLGRALVHPAALGVVRILAAAAFVLTVLAGVIGVANPYRNLAPVMVWVIAWVGLAFVCALVGNVWTLINPWRILFGWAERLTGRTLSAGLRYPAAAGVWPAAALFLVFAWGEINWSGSGIPSNLSAALAAYSAITWAGMALFGRDTWLRHGETFSVVFDLFGRFAVVEAEALNGRVRLWLRPPAIGLICRGPPSFSLMVFVLLVLASVTYDGFGETEAFQTAALALFNLLQGAGTLAVPLVGTIGLASFPLIFLAIYLLATALMWAAGGGRVPFAELAPRFVLSLVPIAIAYHLSHYLSFLVFDGQSLVALLSDPFGFGWDLFGTAGYRVDLTIMSAGFIWYFSVCAIVLGHVAAVYVAHAEAMLVFGDRRRAFASQLPMVMLMVGYTMLSLWIIAQPIMA